MATFEKGLHEVADGVHAYLQPDGTWGWSNAGLVTGDGGSVLVDTLFDLHLTRSMLDAMAPVTGTRPIGTVVNTHANGDHCYGNQLVVDGSAPGAAPAVEVVASEASATEMDEVPAALLHSLTASDLEGPLATFVDRAFGPFDFGGIAVPPPTRTFTGRTTVEAAGRTVELIEVGPAHTGGDVVAWVPDAGVVFTGDILFVQGTPIMWAGPIGNWVAACELVEGLGASVVVPGHGPLTDAAGVREVAGYLRFVRDGVAARHAAGMGPAEAARDLDAEVDALPYGEWTDRERLLVTVHVAWRELEPGRPAPGVVELLTMMGAYMDEHRR
jgi:glyoxylase-like metal-dependent hydrolase (beta-lactamase superfamily II)